MTAAVDDDEICTWIAELRAAIAGDKGAAMAEDELEERLRSLEAERLRPVPRPPATEFRRRVEAFEKQLEQLGEEHYGTKTAPETDDREGVDDGP